MLVQGLYALLLLGAYAAVVAILALAMSHEGARVFVAAVMPFVAIVVYLHGRAEGRGGL